MIPKFILHAFLISLSSLLPWAWILNEATATYTLQLCGGLVIVYIGFKKFLGQTNHSFNSNILTILTANSITQLLIFSTGGTSSPLFFLYYFLIFAFAIIYESYQSLTIALVTVLIYLFHSNFSLDSATTASLFSLLLITPLAQAFSKTMINNLEAKGKIKLLEETLKQEETDSLLWISTSAKPSITSIFNSISDILIYLNSTHHNLSIPKSLIDKIKHIQSDLLTLYTSTNELKNSLEEESDNNKI